ncbi:MAG: hypothetical protein SOZ59_14440 [Candidatus Limivivens sp.]|nr:hypothetical protein [Candidatus Limivivens sp.]
MKKIGKRLILSAFVLGAALLAGPVGNPECGQVQAATVKKGLKKENGKYYYYVNGKKLKSSWKTIGSYRYYFGKDGSAYTGRKKISGTYYYFASNGRMQKSCIQKVNGKYYYFDSKGRMKKSAWVTCKKYKYYLSSNGAALTGIRVLNGKFYYFLSNGKYSTARTKKLRAAAQYEADFGALKKIIGEPKKAEYLASCYGSGDDGILIYANFTIYTYRENGKEIYMGVE